MLNKIFEREPYLLENESVKNLIKYCEDRFNDLRKENAKLQKDYDDILEVFMYSEIILKHGLDCKSSLKKIGEILNR